MVSKKKAAELAVSTSRASASGAAQMSQDARFGSLGASGKAAAAASAEKPARERQLAAFFSEILSEFVVFL